jgi:hypothetical protein
MRSTAALAYLLIALNGSPSMGDHSSEGHSHSHSHGDEGLHTHEAKLDCTANFCSTLLSRDLEKRWHIHLPADHDPNDDSCAKCEITIQLIYSGYTWLGIGVSPDGGMVGSSVVIGRPSEEDPRLYNLEGKMLMRVRPVYGAELKNASIKYVNDQTIMEFRAAFDMFGVTFEDTDEWKEVGMSLKNPTSFIYAHGNEGNVELNYHGPSKGYYNFENLINPEAASLVTDDEKSASALTMTQQQSKSTKNAWMVHGIFAALAWGLFAPIAISAAVLRDLPIKKYPFKDFIAKFWLYAHAGLNSLNYLFTIVAFSLAVNNTSREMDEHFDMKHPKMGLSIFILVSFQVVGGFLRPSNKTKSTLRKAWEVIHHLLGITLFVLGVYQLYTGLSIYRDRYSGSSVAYGVLYIVLGILVTVFATIIFGGTLYKLYIQLRGGGKEENIQNTEHVSTAISEDAPMNGDVGDLNFKEEDVSSSNGEQSKDTKEVI